MQTHWMRYGFIYGLLLSAIFAFKDLDETPACAISLDKQNVFYIGVDNPVSVVVRGVPLEDVQVRSGNLSVVNQAGSPDRYTVRANTPGEATITVSGGKLPPTEFKYRVKRIPDPRPLLGARLKSGAIANGVFRAQGGIAAVLENFDFDARCDVLGYEVNYISPKQDPVTVQNEGARFDEDASPLIQKAKPGDVYFFDEIRCRCPGDAGARKLCSLVFKIK